MNMMPVVALSVSSQTEDIVELTSTVEEIFFRKSRKLMALHLQRLQVSILKKCNLRITMKKWLNLV